MQTVPKVQRVSAVGAVDISIEGLRGVPLRTAPCSVYELPEMSLGQPEIQATQQSTLAVSSSHHAPNERVLMLYGRYCNLRVVPNGEAGREAIMYLTTKIREFRDLGYAEESLESPETEVSEVTRCYQERLKIPEEPGHDRPLL